MSLNLNAAACYLKLNKLSDAVDRCNKVLANDGRSFTDYITTTLFKLTPNNLDPRCVLHSASAGRIQIVGR